MKSYTIAVSLLAVFLNSPALAGSFTFSNLRTNFEGPSGNFFAQDINDHGVVAGYTNIEYPSGGYAYSSEGYFWLPDGQTVKAHIDSDGLSRFHGINNAGIAAGEYRPPPGGCGGHPKGCLTGGANFRVAFVDSPMGPVDQPEIPRTPSHPS